MSKYNYIEFRQPIGTYYFIKISAIDLLSVYDVRRREYTGDTGEGIQRHLNDSRVKEISNYVITTDATFPTAVIASTVFENVQFKDNKLTFKGQLDIIDGQHRIEGLKLAQKLYGESAIEDFELPLVLTLEPTEEQKAYIFATINGNQAKVDKSIIYDLFGIADNDLDPFTFSHKIARALNFSKESPFHGRLKMLGRKSDPGSDEVLSQGTFVKVLLEKISKKPFDDRELARTGKLSSIDGLLLRPFYLQNDLSALVALMTTYFNGVKNAFPTEWKETDSYILCKTTGYIGLMKGLDEVVSYKKRSGLSFDKAVFKVMEKLKKNLESEGRELTKEHFLPGTTGQNLFKDEIHKAIESLAD